MTTFEQFFKENPDQKEIYEKEYSDFLLSENNHGDFKGRSPLGEGVVRSLRSLSSFLRKLAARWEGFPLICGLFPIEL